MIIDKLRKIYRLGNGDNELSRNQGEAAIRGGFKTSAGPTMVTLADFVRDTESDTSPTFKAWVIRLLSFLDDPGTAKWRIGVVSWGLSDPVIEVRDAVMDCVAAWSKDSALNQILSDHILKTETESFLIDYGRDILNENIL